METIQVITLICTIIMAVASIWCVKIAVEHFSKQLKWSLFADYTKRYQEIILQFPENINESTFSFQDLKRDDKEVYDKTMRYMRAYFDLCSEEYWLHVRGRIDKETWEEWQQGMLFAFSKTAFRNAWKIIDLDTIYYPDFTSFVTTAMEQVTKSAKSKKDVKS